MTTTSESLDTLWDCRTGDEPGVIGGLYLSAAERIKAEGYNPVLAIGRYEGEKGESITTALHYAATVHEHNRAKAMPEITFDADVIEGSITELHEELQTRLAGVLYLTGQTRKQNNRDMENTVAEWEGERHGYGRRLRYYTQDDAVRLLTLAARLIEVIAEDD